MQVEIMASPATPRGRHVGTERQGARPTPAALLRRRARAGARAAMPAVAVAAQVVVLRSQRSETEPLVPEALGPAAMEAALLVAAGVMLPAATAVALWVVLGAKRAVAVVVQAAASRLPRSADFVYHATAAFSSF